MPERGEWWIREDGYTEYSDGDIGDAGHEVNAWNAFIGIDNDTIDAMYRQAHDLGIKNSDFISANGVYFPVLGELYADDNNIEITDDNENELEEWGKKYFIEAGGNMELLEWPGDARSYAMEKHGWIRVVNDRFQCWVFDADALDRIKSFEGWDEEDEMDEENYATIEELSTGKYFEVTYHDLLKAQTVYDVTREATPEIAIRPVIKPFTGVPTRSRPGETKWEYGIGDNPLLRPKQHDQWALDMKVNAVVKMDPADFLYLTTTSETYDKIYDEAQPLEKYNEYIATGQNIIPPVLSIDIESGQVVGHEGRHRAVSLLKNDEHEMAVSIILKKDYSSSRQLTVLDLPSIITGEFDEHRKFITRNLLGIIQSNVQERYQKEPVIKNGPMSMTEFLRLYAATANPSEEPLEFPDQRWVHEQHKPFQVTVISRDKVKKYMDAQPGMVDHMQTWRIREVFPDKIIVESYYNPIFSHPTSDPFYITLSEAKRFPKRRSHA